ncbi:MAG: DNA mismatch repair endonuclease MutL [Bacteroidota bacterium]
MSDSSALDSPGETAGPGLADDGLVRSLPDTLASKIAAGEVVQRPANAVKELVENALDAGATSIDLTIQRAGSELIQVADDGCGMGRTDAVACFGRHATSKLRQFEDLETLRTLGFRGEALASIAAVSRAELKTRRAQDEAGTLVRVRGGDLAETAPVGMAPGTTISVRDLFYNVPARRAFLRTPATEFKHIVETFQALALSHTTVAFSLVHDGTDVYRLPAVEQLADRVADLFGDRYRGHLVPVREATSYLSVRGVVGSPEVARRSRGDQYVFANGRYVKSRSLEHAAASAFGAILPDGTHPFLALFLDVDPRHLDVNVHPTKTEVKFDDERGVYSFVRAVVKKGLAEAGLALDLSQTAPDGMIGTPAIPMGPDTPGFSVSDAPASVPLPELPAPADRSGAGDGSPRAPVLPSLPDAEPSFSLGAQLPSRATLPDGPPASPPIPDPQPFRPLPDAPLGPIPSRAALPESADLGTEADAAERVVWPFRGRYLLSPIASGLLVVDQRAAHERVLFEQALAAMDGGMGQSQQLLFPFSLALAPDDRALLEELQPELRSLGFDLGIQKRAIEVRGVPADVQTGDVQTVLLDLLDRYRRNADVLQLSARENLARSLARRSAFREGHVLTADEAKILIEKLFTCAEPFTDPSGRATMVRIAESEIEQRFG